MKFTLNKNNKDEFISVFIILFYLIWHIIIFNGQYKESLGDDGDAIAHFLIAKWAIKDPSFFVDHWGKPFFTFIMSFFAQYSYVYVQILNLIFIFASAILSFSVAKKLKLSHAWFTVFLVIASPQGFIDAHSTLTEPLCLFLISLAIYFIFNNKFLLAAIIISFTPFVRSEGLIIEIIFFAYFLFSKKLKFIPWLLVGTIIYEIVGMVFFHKPLLWTFNEIPYAVVSQYGKGTWTDVILQSPIAFGTIFWYVTPFAVLYLTFFLILKNSKIKYFNELFFLILGLFCSIMFFHIYARALGKFGSMGLIRVFAIILGVHALILNYFFSNILDLLKLDSKFKSILSSAIFIVVTILCFQSFKKHSEFGYVLGYRLGETPIQKNVKAAVLYIDSIYPNRENRILYSNNSLVAFYENLNINDQSKYRYKDAFLTIKNEDTGKNHILFDMTDYTIYEKDINDSNILTIKTFENKWPWDNDYKKLQLKVYKNK